MKVFGFLRDSAGDKMDAVQYYRTYLPLREVHRHDNGIEVQCAGQEDLKGASNDELGGRDIYTMCRMYHEDCQPFIDEVHRQGGILVLDSDDDLTETYKLVSGHGDEFKEVLGEVDYVTVSTPPLAKLFEQYTRKPVVVLRNCVDGEWIRETSKNGKRLIEGLTLGFTGSPTHWGDWYLPAVPVARIGKDYPEVTIVLHGEMPDYMRFIEKKASVLKLGGVPYSLYPVLLKQFDIVLCAVDSRDRFNEGKSAVKALECMAMGIVPICSQFSAYEDLAIQDAPVVIIGEESRDGWYEAIREMIENVELRKYLSEQGPSWVAEHRDMCHTGYMQWEAFFNEIINREISISR